MPVWYLAIAFLLLAGTVWADYGGLFDFGLQVLGVSETVNQLQKSIQETHQSIIDQYNGARKAIGSTVSSLMNEVDTGALENYLGELLPELDEAMGNSSCVEGLQVKLNGQGTLRLTKGKMTFFDAMALEVETTNGLDEKVLNVSLKFSFPELNLFYYWTFRADGLYERERRGTLLLLQPEPNVIEAVGNVTRVRSELDEEIHQHSCFLKLGPVKLRLGDTFSVEDISYGSFFKDMFGTGYTESIVKKMVNDVSGTILMLLKKSLMEAVIPALKKEDVFCGNDDVTKAVTDPVICDNARDLGSYDN